MSIHGIHHDAMTAQAQYAEWLRRMQAENRAKVAIQTEEAEEAEREAPAEDSEPDSDSENQPQEQAQTPSEDDGHLRSFA